MTDLLDLPDEIIVQILRLIPAREQVVSVSLVCRRLKVLLETTWYWRAHYVRLCKGQQPLLELHSTRLWQEACMHREFAIAGCTDNSQQTLKGGYGLINCVHLLNMNTHGTSSVIAAGSRDHSVYVWRTRPSETTPSSRERSMRDYTMATLKGHNGWVWSLASERDDRAHLLCSGSWDHTVRVWDVSTSDCIATLERLHRGPVLSLCMPERDCLVSASYDKKVRVMDLRQAAAVQMEYKQHKRSVLCVAATQNYIYSGSEDATVCVWDKRNNSLLQRLEFHGLVPSLHLAHNILSLATSAPAPEGDEKLHQVHMYSCPTGQLQEVLHFNTGHSRPITQVLHTLGMIVTASKDGSVRLYTCSSPPGYQTTLKHHISEITGLDYYSNMLAVAEGGRTVALWTT